jgi:hypothetical protein
MAYQPKSPPPDVYDPDDVGIPSSPPLRALKVNFVPSPSPLLKDSYYDHHEDGADTNEWPFDELEIENEGKYGDDSEEESKTAALPSKLPTISEQLGALANAHDDWSPSYARMNAMHSNSRDNNASSVTETANIDHLSPHEYRRELLWPTQMNYYSSNTGDYSSSNRGTTETNDACGTPETIDHMSIDSITNPQIGGFQCTYPGCTAQPFQTQYLLNSHAHVHVSNRPHYCKVKGCPRSEGGVGFKRKNQMIRHGLVHDSPGYICPFCPDREHKYPRPDNLQR